MAGRSPKKSSARTARRAAERSLLKNVESLDRLAALQRGGAPDRPIEIVSASLVEPIAESMKCVRCEGKLRVEEHVAQTVDGISLRIARVACVSCGARRAIWMRIVTALPS